MKFSTAGYPPSPITVLLRKGTLALLFIALLCTCVRAQTEVPRSATTDVPPGKISVAVNPVYFGLGGYYVNPFYHFPKRWSVGSTLQGGFELPEFARDQFFTVSNEDITVDWSYAVSVEARYRFSQATYDKGFFAVGAMGFEAWKVNSEGAADEFDNWFTSVGVGYNWFPTKNNRLHLGLQYSLIFILNNTDERGVGDEVYNIETLIPPGLLPSAFVIGWRF